MDLNLFRDMLGGRQPGTTAATHYLNRVTPGATNTLKNVILGSPVVKGAAGLVSLPTAATLAVTEALFPARAADGTLTGAIKRGDYVPPAKPKVIGDTPITELRKNMEEARLRYPKAATEDPAPTEEDSLKPGTVLTGADKAPDGSGRSGTQTSLRQPTPAEMLAFLGGVESMKFARPYAGLVQEESLNLPGEEDVSRGDLEFYGYSPEEIDARMSGKGLEWSTDQEVDAPYKIVEQGTGAATKEDIKESMKVRQSEKKPEKRDWMVPYKDKKAMARAAILDTPDIMMGLKRRELMRGHITAGGKKYAITDKFLKTNDPKDLGRVLTSDEVAAAKAQEFLGDKLENIKKPPAGSQNNIDANDSTEDPTSVQTYKKNNQTPIELDADEIADMEYGGKTPEEIQQLRKGFLPEVVIGEKEEMRLF